jgi:hypothetical protein
LNWRGCEHPREAHPWDEARGTSPLASSRDKLSVSLTTWGRPHGRGTVIFWASPSPCLPVREKPVRWARLYNPSQAKDWRRRERSERVRASATGVPFLPEWYQRAQTRHLPPLLLAATDSLERTPAFTLYAASDGTFCAHPSWTPLDSASEASPQCNQVPSNGIWPGAPREGSGDEAWFLLGRGRRYFPRGGNRESTRCGT